MNRCFQEHPFAAGERKINKIYQRKLKLGDGSWVLEIAYSCNSCGLNPENAKMNKESKKIQFFILKTEKTSKILLVLMKKTINPCNVVSCCGDSYCQMLMEF